MIAKKVGVGRYELKNDAGEVFASLAHAGARWTLASPNKVLVALFLHTKLTADITLQGVLWTVRAILDAIEAKRTAEREEAERAEYARELDAIRENARTDGRGLAHVGFKTAVTA